jgi:hypothetical protein
MTPTAVMRAHPLPTRANDGASIVPAVADTADRSSLRIEIYGWVATLAFVAFSYALRRLLNRPRQR